MVTQGFKARDAFPDAVHSNERADNLPDEWVPRGAAVGARVGGGGSNVSAIILQTDEQHTPRNRPQGVGNLERWDAGPFGVWSVCLDRISSDA